MAVRKLTPPYIAFKLKARQTPVPISMIGIGKLPLVGFGGEASSSLYTPTLEKEILAEAVK